MIENGFLTTRALVLNAYETSLRMGIINFLKELEINWEEYLNRHDEADEYEHDEVNVPYLTPWEVADSLFQFIMFNERRELGNDNYEPEVVEPLTEEEIEREIKRFREQLGAEEEENE